MNIEAIENIRNVETYHDKQIKVKGFLGAQKSAAFPEGDPQRWRGETRGLQLKLFKIVHG